MKFKTEPNKLNEYSQKVFEYLKENTSDLLNYTSFFPDKNFGDNYLEVRYISPTNNLDYDLYLNTKHTNLTVGFYKFHCHYDGFVDADFFGEIKKALETFTKIALEEIIGVLYFNKEEHICSSILAINDLNVNGLNTPKWLKSKPDKVILVSWLGTYNNERSL